MPCRALVISKVESKFQPGKFLDKDRPCGKKDMVAFRVRKNYNGSNTWEEVYTFCVDHGVGRENLSSWTRYNTSRVYSSTSMEIIEQIPVPDMKKSKVNRNRDCVKYAFKKTLNTKYGSAFSIEELIEILVDSRNEIIVESVNNS